MNDEMIDARTQVVIDPKKLKMWEQKEMSESIGQSIIILAHYLLDTNGNPVSPGVPYKPKRKLTKKDYAQIYNSKAYEIVECYDEAKIKGAVASIESATNGF